MCAFVYKWNCTSDGSLRPRSISVLGVCTAECVLKLQAERESAREREGGRAGRGEALCVFFTITLLLCSDERGRKALSAD